MGFDMLFQVLGALECLSTKVTPVRLQRDVDSNVGRDMITLYGGRAAVRPLASEVEVIGALAADMAFADMLL